MSVAQWVLSPFLDYGFMRRALAGACALSLGAAPLGVFLVLRRMSLMGDAMSHAILPGVAAGFLLAGLSLGAMMLGGIVTGLAVALLAGLVARLTPLREDASFAAFYLISLGLGVLVSKATHGSFQMIYSTASMVAAFSCSTLIGVLFGYLPARNAARLDPVEALARE